MDPRLKESLDRIFHPRAAAIAGVSERRDNPGTLLLRSFLDMGFEGDLFPVNPRHEEIMGMKCYPDISSLPRVPDLVILSVPPEAVPGLVRECAEAGVGGCVVNTAGFAETGRPEGKRLEEEIREILRRSRLRLVGPNCMGIYSARGKVALFAGMFPVPGRAGMISQSGSISSISFLTGMERGILFDKIVSSGNELDLNCADYLEYLAEDPGVEIVLAYLEEVRDARRFLDTALRMRGRKPLVMIKGGLTPSGERAAASHTAALGGSAEIFRGAARQAGIVLAEDLAQMLDFASALLHLPPCGGDRVAVVSAPGGLGVNSADSVERAGLSMARVSPRTREALASFLPREGTSFSNPVDLGFGAVVPGNYRRVLELLDRDPEVDIILAVGSAPASRDGDIGLIQAITDEVLKAKPEMSKPVVVVLFPSSLVQPQAARLYQAGVPAYLTPTAACLSLRYYVDFHRFPTEEGG